MYNQLQLVQNETTNTVLTETFQEVDKELAARVERWLQQGTKNHGWVDGYHVQTGLLPVFERNLFRYGLGNSIPALQRPNDFVRSLFYYQIIY
jgi:hypothetical protein